MSAPSVSVIVVSRGRAADLSLCLTGISQLDYPNFEVVLVADKDGIDAANGLSFFDDLNVVLFEEANISAARNLGIKAAAGEIVAFIDDDAVPEPSWLTHLVSGFYKPDVAATGGFVIGRNGISFQWKARAVDCLGIATPLVVDETDVNVPVTPKDHAVKTEGTNMAFRRDVIAKMGGFDPAFRFFLDETDVNFRLMKAGYRTAIAPLAQVHHGYKASATRRGDRVPTDLFEIGASLAVFLRKHAPCESHDDALESMRSEQRHRAIRHMINGAIEPREVKRLMHSFDGGVRDGKSREIGASELIPRARSDFKAFPPGFFGQHQVFSGRFHRRKSLMLLGESAVKSGHRASVFVFSFTARPHKVRFTQTGVWLQSGGLFGRSTRSGPRIRVQSPRKRLSLELKRLAKLRNFPSKQS